MDLFFCSLFLYMQFFEFIKPFNYYYIFQLLQTQHFFYLLILFKIAGYKALSNQKSIIKYPYNENQYIKIVSI